MKIDWALFSAALAGGLLAIVVAVVMVEVLSR